MLRQAVVLTAEPIIVAIRGITAGSVHATSELRVLLIQWLDETIALFPLASLTVYVDGTSIEATGPPLAVKLTVAGATKHFTKCLRRIGMDFSPTKNGCLASSQKLASAIILQLPGLNANMLERAKSLGGALGTGKKRNAKVQKKRLQCFQVRKAHFQKLRRLVGARRSNLVLRTGGTAALVYGQANTGVSNSTLLAQRRAVAAASVPGGAGDLNLTLILADGSMQGRADPAFAAHEDPIGCWSEAVWNSWLPRCALHTLADHAIQRLATACSPWASVAGSAAAFVASANRLGWVVEGALGMQTDRGVRLDLRHDSPA